MPASSHRAAQRDHPRLRGEQSISRKYAKQWEGSPPLARGTEKNETSNSDGNGITPACAGNSRLAVCDYCMEEDHPRLRREQTRWTMIGTGRLGSPPLARGTAFGFKQPIVIDGITPACAGNRCFATMLLMASKDHPRLRGEQFCVPCLGVVHQGSPPLARGTVGDIQRRRDWDRITPACAGNRHLLWRWGAGK